MSIQLEAIAFNHDPTAATHDALNLRRNYGQPLPAPEWQRGAHLGTDAVVACYAANMTQGNTLTLRAQFRRLSASLTHVQVRAVSDGPLTAAQNQVLGEVSPRTIVFGPNGESDFVLFELQGAEPWRYGVGTHSVRWLWQFRSDLGGGWLPFARTQHRICTVLGIPTAPWQQDGYPYNTQLPWADVLVYACQWARSAVTSSSAARRITHAVYALGQQGLLAYNCANMGAPMYVSPDFVPPYLFDCSAFLERLGGGVGAGLFVNCSDCAAIVSTFANSLGCDLWQSRMGIFPEGFSLNPILPVGATQWGKPCGWWPGFGMHEVAWLGQCDTNAELFDACLALDRDANPLRPPHHQVVPVNVPFGHVGDGQYADRLVAPEDRAACQPWPSTRQRRLVI
ncbi:MAG: hypothetical protein DYG89_40715 [Caldilinea sp. CFX5]|nr:hypothetical protein [Caldilinea sp. CFX5]